MAGSEREAGEVVKEAKKRDTSVLVSKHWHRVPRRVGGPIGTTVNSSFLFKLLIAL